MTRPKKPFSPSGCNSVVSNLFLPKKLGDALGEAHF